MKEFKTLFACGVIFFCINAAASTEKNRVLDEFFNVAKELQAEQTPDIENMEARVNAEIKFAERTFSVLQPFVNSIFETSMPRTLTSEGFLKIGLQSVEGQNKIEQLYLYSESDIGNFILAKSGEKIELHLPRLGIIIDDTMPEMQSALQQHANISETPTGFPADFITSILSYIGANEANIREKIKMEERKGFVNGQTTHFFTYPVDNGTFTIEIYDEVWTFASVSFSGENRKNHMHLKYPAPREKQSIAAFLPESVHLKGENSDNLMDVKLSDIRYNRFFSAGDYKVQRINFREFVTLLYFRFLQAPR